MDKFPCLGESTDFGGKMSKQQQSEACYLHLLTDSSWDFIAGEDLLHPLATARFYKQLVGDCMNVIALIINNFHTYSGEVGILWEAGGDVALGTRGIILLLDYF